MIDRSGSMSLDDRSPQRGSTGNNRICDRGYMDRLGAAYSALYAFWTARDAALTALAGRGGTPPRRDAYSVVLFNERASIVVQNDFTATPDQLLERLLTSHASGGTSFDAALERAHWLLETCWSNER